MPVLMLSFMHLCCDLTLGPTSTLQLSLDMYWALESWQQCFHQTSAGCISCNLATKVRLSHINRLFWSRSSLSDWDFTVLYLELALHVTSSQMWARSRHTAPFAGSVKLSYVLEGVNLPRQALCECLSLSLIKTTINAEKSDERAHPYQTWSLHNATLRGRPLNVFTRSSS